MARAKTSKKREAFSPKNMQPGNVKEGVKTYSHDPREKLADPEFIGRALFQCMIEGDMEEFKDTLRAHYEAVNTTKALKQAGLSKRTFYSALSKDGNPSLSTVMKMIAGLRGA